jgi:hypothetical protein
MDELLPGLFIMEERPPQGGDEDEIKEMGQSKPVSPSSLGCFMSGSPDDWTLILLALQHF